MEFLFHKEIDGYDVVIVSYGTHPCAYIGVDINHVLYKINYWNIHDFIDVHGGLTYSNYLLGNGLWYFGWDYNHFDDCFKALNDFKNLTLLLKHDPVLYRRVLDDNHT